MTCHDHRSTAKPDDERQPVPSGKGIAGIASRRAVTPTGTEREPDGTMLSGLPIAMLPVRIETRYAGNGSILRIRIFPDDCAVDSHEKPLTKEEREAAIRYRAAPTPQCWQDMVAQFGPARAAWLAQVPVGGTGDPGTRAARWTRAPCTRVLPSRWYAFGYKGGQRVFTASSNAVPEVLAVGPDPGASSSAGENELVDRGVRWLVDFGAAMEQGMALEVTLPEAARGRLDRLVVIGVRLSATAGAADLREMLDAHHFTRGLGFLEEGTPTNNTREESSPLNSTTVATPVPPGKLTFTPRDGSNRDVTSRALGLDEATFAGLDGSDAGAAVNLGRRAMCEALWPATLGYYIDQLLVPAVGRDLTDAVRAHFIAWVRGSGPLPILRFGDQPYGLLIATPLDRLQPWENDAPAGLVNLVTRGIGIWRDSLGEVPRVGRPSTADESANLLAALALQPHSLSYRGRSVLGHDYVNAAWRFLRERLPDSWWQRQGTEARWLLDKLGVTEHPRLETSTYASEYFSLSSPLVISNPPLDRAAMLQPNYLAWLSGEGRPGYRELRDETFPQLATLPPPRPLLYLLARHSLLLCYLEAARRTQPHLVTGGRDEELVGVDEIDDDFAAPRPPTPWDELGYAAKGRWLDGHDVPPLDGLRAALRALAVLPARTLERLLVETLDVCSYRLDAWATSIAYRRLNTLRSWQPIGVHLGGWGAVVDLEPNPTARESRGFLHVPSVTHATAAAILASGYLAHHQEQGRHPLAVDLSSQRVQLALKLLDGVRHGASLGALLGQRFERELHERKLDRLVDDFRRFAPLRGSPSGSDGAEPLAARSVVDGLELQRRWVKAGRRSDLGGWPGGPGDRTSIDMALAKLDDAVDAIADVLLAEGVFQMARGNAARAAGAIDAAAAKGPPPPELEVVRTPRDGLSMSHRLLILVPGNATASGEWAIPVAETPARVVVEPRLDAIAARFLPSPRRVVCGVQYVDRASQTVIATQTFRLDELRPWLSALDVLCDTVTQDTPQRSEFEERLLYHAARTRPDGVPVGAVPSLVAHPENVGADDVRLPELLEAARAARAALIGPRPITPADLCAPERSPAAVIQCDELETRSNIAVRIIGEITEHLAGTIGGAAEETRAALLAAARLGVAGAIPISAIGDEDTDRAALQDQAERVLATLRQRMIAVDAIPPAGQEPADRSDHAIAVLRCVFGGGFRAMPLLSIAATSDPLHLDVSFPQSEAITSGDALAITAWLQRAMRVRDGTRRFADAALYAEALSGAPLSLAVAQLPAAPGDRWIGLPFAGDNSVPVGRLSIVAALPIGTPDGSSVTGLLVDEWTETVPAAQTTTAVALHMNSPNACAPQAIILAVPPRREGWTLSDLEATVLQTLDLAEARMVDPDVLLRAGQFLPAIHLAANLRGATISTDLKHGRGWGVS